MNENNIEKIATLATTIAAEEAASMQALESSKKAESELIARLIAAAKPGLRAIGSRREISYRHYWIDSARADEDAEYSEKRMVRVLGKCIESRTSSTGGEYAGHALFVREDGALVQHTYEGTWTQWQGQTSSWEAKERVYASALEALDDGWEDVAESLVEVFNESFTKAVGTRENATKAAMKRAEKFAALAKLI